MLNTLKISRDLRNTVERELQFGESIRWIEQPVPKFLTAGSIGVVVFGIPWTSFAVFWMWGAMGFELPDLTKGFQPQYLFALFGIPFVLIGLGMLSSPLWIWQAARNTVYLITDKRAILIARGWSTTIRSYTFDQLNEIYRREGRDGTGDVIITVRRWKDSEGDARSEEIGFIGIRNPQEVEKKLRRLSETR